MSWVFGTIALTMGIVFLWGALAPRSQWRALSGWSVSDAHAHEPGGAAYGIRRLVSAVGVVGLTSVLLVTTSSIMVSPRSMPPPTDIQVMWGSPEPQLVDRVFHNLAQPPVGLVEVAVLGYQTIDEDAPEYFLRLRPFSLLGSDRVPGYIGADPDEGFSAIGSADIVVHVRGPVLCIPRKAVVIETEKSVQIGIYYGLPDPVEGAPAPDNAIGCPHDSPVTGSVLIPIGLAAPVGERDVVALDGTELHEVSLVG